MVKVGKGGMAATVRTPKTCPDAFLLSLVLNKSLKPLVERRRTQLPLDHRRKLIAVRGRNNNLTPGEGQENIPNPDH